MKVSAVHGYYKIWPEGPSELAILKHDFGFTLVNNGDYFVPERQNYKVMIQGLTFNNGVPITVSSECNSEGFRNNGFVFSWLHDNIVLLNTIVMTQNAIMLQDGSYLCDGMPQCGAFFGTRRLAGFFGSFDFVNNQTVLTNVELL